jgi:hypothetical protein
MTLLQPVVLEQTNAVLRSCLGMLLASIAVEGCERHLADNWRLCAWTLLQCAKQHLESLAFVANTVAEGDVAC